MQTRCIDSRLTPFMEQLPVASIAERVNSELDTHPRLIVTAPPGAGKSTLLPLTILSSLPDGKILMLEPRRIAARQVAERMAKMIGERVGETIGYRVRFETKVSASTRVEVLTEGILTRMLIDDPTLDGVSVVIFDEYHERSLVSDTALALTRETQSLIRPDLRIVLMSATIDADQLCRSFDAPLVESEGRMYDVDIVNFDDTDAVRCADDVASAVMKAHREHEGDILAFLPGQAEIVRCSDLLEGKLGATRIFPLYGKLSSPEQQSAIDPSPKGSRKVVIATSIAETSITIEGVRIVIDSGLCRKMVYDERNGLSHLDTVRVSMDMARQRAGRAGRVSNGICYRLWTKATEHHLDECRQPEILYADLTPVVLDIAAWGGSDIMKLPWTTMPTTSKVNKASRLLESLNAIDNKGMITAHGRELSKLPCHPRIAEMLVKAADAKEKSLAADIAALLEERDIINTEIDSDINTRISLLREIRAKSRKGRIGKVMIVAEQYLHMMGVTADNCMPNPYTTGKLLASAYPERVAMAISHGRYRLACGDEVAINNSDDLISCQLLAVASSGKRIFLASPLSVKDIDDIARWQDNVYWDNKQGRVVVRREQRIGALVIDTRATENVSGEDIVRVICEAARKDGLSMFSIDDDVQRLIVRIATVAEWHPELSLPAIDVDSLLDSAAEWLPLYIGKATTATELRKINLNEVIWGMLDYGQQMAVDRIAPTHLQVPTGSRIRIDYRQGASAPVVSVRLQECFGLTDTPCVDDGQRRVVLELLSPGFKPVQLTQDLRSFWQSAYFEVRKELRRRYPKHSWPDNPLEAEAVRGVRRPKP